ncbi:MAG: hypothetical protein CVT48_02965 [Thermoplasmata archaeon HGW-Thermoplasmata-1]|nr:MAG: hypothetical protein CVT48_02965 [Thermoplasmata archaeon HGW-Thermoplasmata-1]
MYPLGTLANYPFLSEAREWVKEHGPTMEELFFDAIYQRARAIGAQRVRESIEGSSVGERPVISETDSEMELFSYPLAKMIVAAAGDPYLTRRYAMAEAKSVYSHLLEEDGEFIKEVSSQFAMDARRLGDSGGAEAGGDGGIYRLHFADYLRNAPARDRGWKLVNRRLSGGYVECDAVELARLVQEAFRARLEAEMKTAKAPDEARRVFSGEIGAIRNAARMKREEFEGEGFGKADAELFPPCMKVILAMIQGGANVPHTGRFGIVAFLHTIGMSSDDILALFSTAPDFDVEKSRYQVEHITGRGSSTEYTPPGCQAMKTFGICPTDRMDGLCRRVKHPLNYYRAKLRSHNRRGQKKEADTAEAAKEVSAKDAAAKTSQSAPRPDESGRKEDSGNERGGFDVY